MKHLFSIVSRTVTDVYECPECKGKGNFGSYKDDYGCWQMDTCQFCRGMKTVSVSSTNTKELKKGTRKPRKKVSKSKKSSKSKKPAKYVHKGTKTGRVPLKEDVDKSADSIFPCRSYTR